MTSRSKTKTVRNPQDTLQYWGGIRPLARRLGKPEIVERNRDAIATELLCLGLAAVTDVLSWDETGRVKVKASRDIPAAALKAVRKIKVTEDRDGNHTLEVEMYDKIAALRVMARAAGLLDQAEEESDKPTVIGINMTGPDVTTYHVEEPKDEGKEEKDDDEE